MRGAYMLSVCYDVGNKQAELTKCPYVAPEVVTQLETLPLYHLCAL